MSARPFRYEKSYPPGVRWDAELRLTTLPALLAQSVATYGPRVAIEFRGREISFAALGEAVDRAAAGFAALGLEPGRQVALYMPNTPYQPIALFGALKAGARVVQLSPLDAERELAHKLADSEARTLVTIDSPVLLPVALRLLAAGAIDRLVVGEDAAWGPPLAPPAPIPAGDSRVTTFAAMTARGAPPAAWPAVEPADLALLQYTGGTTGVPKGAMLTHANLTAAVSIYNAWYEGQGTLRRGGEERAICVLPLFHIFALTVCLLRYVANGNTLLLRERFDPAATLDDIEKRRATAFMGVPTMWIALAAAPDLERRDLSSLRHLTSGGAPLPVEVGERFARRTGGLRIGGGWGMTETSPAGTHLPLGHPIGPGVIGLPLPRIEMDVVALDDPRRALPAGETGEIRIRGPNVTAGYWKRPAESEAAFVDGYLMTGDIGTMDEGGFVQLVDRRKDMIISAGFNVFPRVVEDAIYEHPDVEEAIVIGVPDAYRGEAGKAFVKLRAGAKPLTLEALRAFLADKLGRHEQPTALEIREALPRTAVGKLSKRTLVEEERARRDASAPRPAA